MQTTGLPSSHLVSNRPASDNSASEKAHATAKFSEAMHRALTGADAKSSERKLPDSSLAEAAASKSKTDSPEIDEGNNTGEKKRARAKKNSEPAPAATVSQPLGLAGVPLAIPQPVAQPAGNSHDTDKTKGSITAISDGSTKAETIDATPTADVESVAPSVEAAPPGAAPTAKIETSAKKPEHTPAIGSTATQELAAPAIETISPPANPAKANPLANAAAQDKGDLSAKADLSAKSAVSAEAAPSTEAAAPIDTTPVTDTVRLALAASLGETAPPVETPPSNTEDIGAITSLAQADASPPDIRGTSAAKQDITMKKVEKALKVAGSAEQDLPGMAAIGSEELPKGQKLSTKEAGHGSEKLETAAIELPVRVLTSSESPASTVTAAAPTSSPALDSRVLERTHDIIALHAMRVGEYTSDSMHVVVKPGAGIQLSLELRQSARGIEVHASLHKGDFEQLNQHWPDLQQRLEARGIRVGSLTTSENFSSTSHQQFQQSKQQSPNQDPLYAGAFAEFALAGSMTEAPAARAARATAYRGWETWA